MEALFILQSKNNFSIFTIPNHINMQPINILLIEDNAGDILLTTEALEEGHIAKSIAVVNDGLQAMDFLHKKGQFSNVFSPDLVLLDINLPKLNGLEVLERIKTDVFLKDLPVIILSTSSSEEDISKSYEHFADEFITKPTDGNESLKVVDTIKNFWVSKRVILNNVQSEAHDR